MRPFVESFIACAYGAFIVGAFYAVAAVMGWL